MIVDLVSPWAAAFDAPDATRACALFRARHAELLEALRRQRAPHLGVFPLPDERQGLRQLASQASNLDLQQRLRDQLHAAARLGALEPAAVVLVVGDDGGDPIEALPGRRPTIALFLDRSVDTIDLGVGLSRGLASLTRWCAADSESAVRAVMREPWDRWQLAREIPLAEWLYAEGAGVHLAHALLPDAPPHRLLGCSRGALRRIREREHAFRALLEADLDHTGLGLVLRWLAPQAPASVRTAGGTVLPPGTGQYLAWRMMAERVERVGIGDALRMSVDR